MCVLTFPCWQSQRTPVSSVATWPQQATLRKKPLDKQKCLEGKQGKVWQIKPCRSFLWNQTNSNKRLNCKKEENCHLCSLLSFITWYNAKLPSNHQMLHYLEMLLQLPCVRSLRSIFMDCFIRSRWPDGERVLHHYRKNNWKCPSSWRNVTGVNGWTCLAMMLKRVLLWFYLGLHFCLSPSVSSICQGLTSMRIIRSYVPISVLNIVRIVAFLKCWTTLQQFSNLPFSFQPWCLSYGLLYHPLSTCMWTLTCFCSCCL